MQLETVIVLFQEDEKSHSWPQKGTTGLMNQSEL